MADQQLTLHVVYTDDGSIKILDAGGAALGDVTRKADAANIPFRQLSMVLSSIGATGPASLFRTAGAVNVLTGAVGTLEAAALPVLLVLGAILAAVLAVAGAALAWKAAFDFASTATNNAGEQLRAFAGPDGPLGQLRSGFELLKGSIANSIAPVLVRVLLAAQVIIINFLNAIIPDVDLGDQCRDRGGDRNPGHRAWEKAIRRCNNHPVGGVDADRGRHLLA